MRFVQMCPTFQTFFSNLPPKVSLNMPGIISDPLYPPTHALMLGIRLAGFLWATSGVSGQSRGVNTHLLQLCMKRIYSNQPLAAEADPLTHIYSNGCRGAVSRHANGGCVWQRSAPRGQRGPVCVKVCVSSVSLSRPPSQVINVNAFSLRLTQMGADAHSRALTHTHALIFA